MQVRICPKCGAKNPISRFSCESCNADISMEPFLEQKEPKARMYKICPTCNAHVDIKSKTEIVKFCPVCRSDAIHRLGEEQVETEQAEARQDGGGELLKEDSSEKKRAGAVLRNKRDGVCVFVGEGTHMIGAYGDCEPDYFWNLQYVSSEHLIMKVTGEKVFATDNNSKNHSWVNDECLRPYKETELMDGDILKLADQYFEVELCR